jgi:hypothetical protein
MALEVLRGSITTFAGKKNETMLRHLVSYLFHLKIIIIWPAAVAQW